MENHPSECYKGNPRRGLARVSAYQLAEYKRKEWCKWSYTTDRKALLNFPAKEEILIWCERPTAGTSTKKRINKFRIL